MPRGRKKKKITRRNIPNPVKLQAPKGVRDILPEEQEYFDFIVNIFSDLAKKYGFKKIDIPIFEDTSLFERGVGTGTDIVDKEMYTFRDRAGRSLTLRPEATAGIARSYIENGMSSWSKPVKLFCIGPMFRYDQPQRGRFRQFYQFDFEILGRMDPILDVQAIQLAWNVYRKLGLQNLNIQINSVGCQECREIYKNILIDYYGKGGSKLCCDCRRRIKTNPLRLLDCKEEKCQRLSNNVPQIIDHLCEECHNHFKSVLEYLDGLEFPYVLNPRLVRGLDYYTKTVFEIWPGGDKAFLSQGSLGGGGRYDELIELLGGDSTPGLGFAGGMERTIDEMKLQGIKPPQSKKPDIFFAQLGEHAKRESLKIYQKLLDENLNVAEAFGKDSLKAQLKIADKLGVKLTLILGQKEVIDKTIIFRDMETGIQEIINIDKFINEIKKRLKNKSVISNYSL